MWSGFFLAGGLALVAGLLCWDQGRRHRAQRRAALRASWGTEPGRRRELRPGIPSAGPLRLDDQAWADLDLDAVFALLDRTLTEPGQQVLP